MPSALTPKCSAQLRPNLQVDCTSDAKLNLPLLQFHEDATPELPLLAVNFDPALVALLRETKYFLLLQIRVPDAAAAVFERADTYRSQISSLELMVGSTRFCVRAVQLEAAELDGLALESYTPAAVLPACARRALCAQQLLHSPQPLVAQRRAAFFSSPLASPGDAVQPHPAHHPACGEALGRRQASGCGWGALAVSALFLSSA